jgi:5-methylcytosine-specific restriction endonuclease McrA
MKNKGLYAANWADMVRPSILMRDNYKCRHCGIEHRHWYYIDQYGDYRPMHKDLVNDYLKKGIRVRFTYLQVAHLDHNPANNEHSNLISLCDVCHLKNDRAFSTAKRLSK